MERTTEPKIVLLVRLLNAIDEGRYSFEELKDRIAEDGRRPSTRSMRRYLAVLGDAGFPWYFDRAANRYGFADGYSLKRLDLSSGELFGLVALRSIGASVGGSIGGSIDEITDKLVGSSRGAKARLDRPSPVAFRLPEIRLDENGERAFAQLSAAERALRSVEFVYHDKEGKRSTRKADPYGFVVSHGRVYCVAYDHARRAKRTFAVDNVADVRTLTATFAKPEGFDLASFAGTSISGVLHGADLTDVRVTFARRVAKAAVAARIVTDSAVKYAEDGAVEITYRVADVDELVRWVLGWGTQAEILAPPDVRARIAELSAEVAAKYANAKVHT
ncbi:MAG: helix-turn-helix transcriptional regulator [Vulcanimicrobiaceae bacterium]